MAYEEKREFKNSFKDFDGKESDVVDVKNATVHSAFHDHAEQLLKCLEQGLRKSINKNDHSVYTGTGGISLLYFHLGCMKDNTKYFSTSLEYLEPSLLKLKGHRLSFLCGDPGSIALGIVLYYRLGRENDMKKLLQKLHNLHSEVLDLDTDLPDELLFGRVGYLYSLLFVQKHIEESFVDKNVIRQVVNVILKSGQRLAKHEKQRSPLMYMWHEKHYLGAAHGLGGILYMLMQAKSFLSREQLETLVHPTVDYLLSLRFPSGNFPSSLSNNTDRLLHWCHGAPGICHVFTKAYEVFEDEKYLQVAKDCGEVIWQRGLLRKGYGICHGVSGNAYAFLQLYQTTQDVKYLHRACKFGEWCFEYGSHDCRTPDRPFSLFEGLAGTVYMLYDIQKPMEARFPAFTL